MAREADAEFERINRGETDHLVPIKLKAPVKRSESRAVVTLRLSGTEAKVISQAAKTQGLTFSDFVRQAALLAAAGGLEGDGAVLLRLLGQIEELKHSADELKLVIKPAPR
jgi:hypothetical protein